MCTEFSNPFPDIDVASVDVNITDTDMETDHLSINPEKLRNV